MNTLTLAAESVSPGVTLLFGGLLVGMIACLAMEEKLHASKSLIVGIFAMVSLLLAEIFGLIHTETVEILGHDVVLPVYIPGIDWAVLSIMVGSSLFVDVISRSGIFSWIAIRLTRASGGDPVRLLWAYGWMTVVFSAVLNNVTAMIIVGSLSVVSLEKLGRRDKLLAFLLIEGLLTNLGGLLTLISSVPNIIVGTAADISFITLFFRACPYVVVATVVTIMMGAKLFDIHGLRSDSEREEARRLVESFDERDGISSSGFFWFSAVMLVLFILTIATTSLIPAVKDLGMGFVALSFAAVMLIRYKHEVSTFYQAIDWDLLGFFAALFALINVMEHARVLAVIGGWLEQLIGLGETMGGSAILLSSAAASSVTDNIPLAAMLAKIMAATPAELNIAGNPDSRFWWAVIFGANLGGNITPIGSASTLVAVTLIHRHKLSLSFGGFVVKALPFALVQLALAVLYVLLVIDFLPGS